VAPLATLGAATVTEAQEAGADLLPLGGKVAQFSLEQDLTTYFDWHHTAADTFDKLDAMDLAIDTAAVAVAAYGLADATETLPIVAPTRRGPPQPAAQPAVSQPGAAPPRSPGATVK
jgi:carboxypeptidase Q